MNLLGGHSKHIEISPDKLKATYVYKKKKRLPLKFPVGTVRSAYPLFPVSKLVSEQDVSSSLISVSTSTSTNSKQKIDLSRIFYYEATILNLGKEQKIGIGLARTEQYP